MGKIQLSIKEDSRFTEEIIHRYENNDKSNIHKYDIAFPKNKTCSISERNPGVNGSKVCKNCYYRDFSDKMEDIRKSKRKEFIEYQVSLREDKLQWLNELEEMLIDYENQFDRADYSFAREYKDVVEDVRREISGEETNENSNGLFGGLQEMIAERIAESVEYIPSDIKESSERFYKDYPNGTRTAFLIMQFTETDVHDKIISTIKNLLLEYNITVLRADDKEYSDDLFANIKTYMHCCEFGISIFERVTEDEFNPNVSLEVGYMMGLNKPVCLLKDKTLKSLQTDLAGKLYKPINLFKIEDTIKKHLNKWLNDKELI
ncbi:hypothetical protein [Psychroserpens damuponensis]|uniref:hypothetical protein n=1 Tax=Psychroserpens damuponensis TaxID=943936 RepID=UPI0006945863|nr:hypothetical protein [Psychroserpens damuponensis]